ncbi:MAG: epoxyqueuosine reductase [Spirochaetes bacterium]|nr:epoxyqueuosine reductase [Spirochaetota bacterium]
MNKHTITKNELVEQVLKFYEKNVYRFKENEIPCIERPIVKFAAADDHQFRIWADNKENPLIKPTEGFILSFGEKALAQTVISWILPISEYSKNSNSRQNKEPSREWILSRFHGENFNNNLRMFISKYLESKNFLAVAGQHASWWKRSPDGISSNWSERHAAYAAGHGSFSLCGGLITEKGIAVRIGSVITNCKFEPDRRKVSGIFDNCLFYNKGICLSCIKRCPVGAISVDGIDRIKCRNNVMSSESKELAEKYGGAVTAGCGLCQSGVPCEHRIP